ncbi:hypothetical protein BDN72DRAFT_858305 [Pluteus cervinus]|uniref:Uncharacterized protein n=1 Tax=Pluteus cervinus TaxID=181527 RepID=A0ACD3ATF4_9AGAR|nr:hypothetical protein BDN72DRAFT_858305 [Pluteus cervinus]
MEHIPKARMLGASTSALRVIRDTTNRRLLYTLMKYLGLECVRSVGLDSMVGDDIEGFRTSIRAPFTHSDSIWKLNCEGDNEYQIRICIADTRDGEDILWLGVAFGAGVFLQQCKGRLTLFCGGTSTAIWSEISKETDEDGEMPASPRSRSTEEAVRVVSKHSPMLWWRNIVRRKMEIVWDCVRVTAGVSHELHVGIPNIRK